MVLEETQTFRVYNRSQFSVEKTVEIRYRIHAPIRKGARGRGMQYFLNMAWLCNCEGQFCFCHLPYRDSDMIFQFFCSLFVVTRYDVDGCLNLGPSYHSTINLAEMCVINSYNSNIATIDVGIAYRICSTQNYCPIILYIAGETMRSLRSRFSEHLRSIWNNTPGYPVTKHFNSTGHSISDILVPDMQLYNETNRTSLQRKQREMRLLFQLQTVQPDGLNINFSYI